MCVFVCPLPRQLITSGVIRCDIYTPYDWLNKFYGFIMRTIINIVSGRDVRMHTCRGSYPSKSKLAL